MQEVVRWVAEAAVARRLTSEREEALIGLSVKVEIHRAPLACSLPLPWLRNYAACSARSLDRLAHACSA